MVNSSQLNSKRITKNTLFLYIRMLLVMVVSIYTSRLVLDALGVNDYGIYNVVGGVVAFLGFLNSSMSNAVQRFLSFELGKNNLVAVNRIFNISLLVHLGIAFLFLIVLECVGPWFVDNYLNMPIDRRPIAQWVLQFSIFTSFFTIIQVPYNAIIIAKEEMDVYAYIGILEVVMKIGIVYFLYVCAFDKLGLYAFLQMLVTIVVLLLTFFYCRYKFVEAKFHFVFNKQILKSISSFAAWNLIGEFSWVMTGQGVNIILNMFCGPVVNAARGISDQVNAAVMRFINNFQIAMNPQVIKTYSAGQLTDMSKLVNRGSRYSFFLLLVLSLPLILEMDYILNLWLVEVPEYAVVFCRLILICSLVSIVTNLFAQVIRATGKIRNYQVATAIVQLMNFPLSYWVLSCGYSPISTIIIAIVIQIIIGLMRLYFVNRMVNYSIIVFFKDCVIPICKVSFLSTIIPILMIVYLNESTFRFILVSFVAVISVLSCSFIFGMGKSEQTRILGMLKVVVAKIKIIR